MIPGYSLLLIGFSFGILAALIAVMARDGAAKDKMGGIEVKMAVHAHETFNLMAHKLIGELDHVSVYTLCKLKKELTGFNAKTRRWK